MTAASQITPRELVILKLLADRRSAKEIASLFGVSETTAKRQVTKVLEKLDARDASEAVAKAVMDGLIGPLASRER